MILALSGVAWGLDPVPAQAGAPAPGMALIPAGVFEMGDHHNYRDAKHASDEVPLHTVRLGAFYMGIHDVTTQEYCAFLNAALAEGLVEARPDGGVYPAGGKDLLCETRLVSPHSRIGWDGTAFTVLDRKESHPVVCVRWHGAALYCNWLGAKRTLPRCYDPATWACDFNKSGFRLPTEAEWEYAARGGRQTPYFNFPWGDDADAARANVPESDNPFRAGPQPWTTPVGFFNGTLRRKADLAWPGQPETYQTKDGANGYGLYDMAGNVWQWCTEWYERDYYAYGPAENPPGPESGGPMPDGKAYRCLRGGSWYNGEFGHARVSNRDPSYFRGPDPSTRLSDPNGPWFHIGFRVVSPVNAESRPLIRPTPVQRVASRQPGAGEGRPRESAARADDRATASRAGGGEGNAAGGEARKRSGSFVLGSPEVKDGGTLPAEYTGDGASATLPLAWSGAPAGTKSYALIMHHIDPQGAAKWYWILYDIPADVQGLPKNVKGVGTLGTNSVNNRTEYAPPRSKGPGAKTYIYTVYALSSPPPLAVPSGPVSRDALLAAMKDRTLGTADLQVVYTRQGAGEGQAQREGQGQREGAGMRDGAGSADRRPREADPAGGDDRRPPPRDDGGRDSASSDGGRERREPGGADERPSGRSDRNAREPRGGGGGGERGGRAAMPENRTPTSPNPGQTVGLFLNTPKACPGYTLMAPKHNTVTYLLDNQGRSVRQWKSEYEPGQSVYLLPNGHLLRACMVKVQGGTGGGEGGRIEEFDWNGNLVWEFTHATRDYQLHHDIKPMPNGHVLALMVERKSREQAIAAGFDPDLMQDDYLVPDAVVEIEPVLPKGGKIVWEWHVWDHLIQNRDRSKPDYGDPAAHPERIDVACNGRSIRAFWNHMNSLDYNPALDQIVLSVRGCNEIWIIDHGTTTQEAAGRAGGRHGKGGDLLYRWGNPAAYKRGATGDKQLVQQHDAQWVPDGFPGAGHLTIFNNGYDRGWSSIEEIVPPVDAQGRYVLETGKAYGPDKPVWHYEAPVPKDFFSSEISGAHRLPNGNMLVCAGVVGHLFEVTPAGETVWQYVNPMVRGGILAQGELPGKDMRGHLWNAVFKVHRYAPDYPGLAGRDLAPIGVIELPASEKGKTGLDGMIEQPRDNRDRPGRGGGGGGGDRQPRGDRPPPRDDRPPREDSGGDRPPGPREP